MTSSSRNSTGASLLYGDVRYTSTALTVAIADMKEACRTAGIGPTSVVILHAALTDRYAIALLALTEMECCVVPVDVLTPPAVLNGVIESTGAVAVLDDTGIRVLGQPHAESAEPTPLGANMVDAAYVLFTSGTTSLPKGVVGSRNGLRSRTDWGCRHFFSPDVNRCAITTNPAFIDSLTQILAAYHSGRTMMVAPLPAQRDLGQLCEFIEAEGIEQITLTPSFIPVLGAVGDRKLHGMRRWIFSGEELRRSWLTQIRRLSPSAEVINSYGSTEVCGDATFYAVAADDPIPDVIPIGRPVAGVSIAIDDVVPDDGGSEAPLPAGAGELWIGGQQVAYGYLSSVHTRDSGRFCRTADGNRWFRTGDIVYESDGLLHFVGRVGDVEKVRGRRVNLAGVVTALESVDGVRAAHAWIDCTDGEAATLRAAVTIEPSATLTPASVSNAVRADVLPHMVPDRIYVVPDFDRTASGKIDVSRIAGDRDGGEPPRSRFATGLQYVIAHVLSRAVEDADVWPTTAFSDVGLDSLRAVGVADELARHLGCRVTAVDVLAAETVEQLALQVPALQTDIRRPATRLAREGAAARTLLLIHPAIGTCLTYFSLLQRISYPGRVVFVEQNDHARATLDSEGMEALAGYYAQEAAAAHPDASFDVAGYSFGALIAPSVARQLHLLGSRVSSVVLIDPATIGPGGQVTTDWALRRVLQDSGYQNHLPTAAMDLAEALAVIRSVDGPLALVSPAHLQHWADCLRANVTHCAGYEPTTPSTSTLVVRATETSDVSTGDTRWLDGIAHRVTMANMDCTHFELLNGASVVELAEVMSEFFAEQVRDG